MNILLGRWRSNAMRTYANPRAVEVGLIESGDDFVDEILSRAETAPLAQQQ